MKVIELTTHIPHSFAQMRLQLAEQDVQKAKQELTKLEEEVRYWKGFLKHKYEDQSSFAPIA